MKSLMLGTAVVAAFLLGGQAFATEIVSFDGQWWQSHDAAEHILLVEGEIDGLRSACVKTAYEVAYGQAPHHQAKFARISHKLLRFCRYTHKFAVYENDITNFYLDHPQKLSTSVGYILSCYSDYTQVHARPEKCADEWASLFH